MIRVWIIFILLLAGIVWVIVYFTKKHKPQNAPPLLPRFAAPVKTNEIWSQLYETNSLDELNLIRMRLGEENLNYIVFEQGKRSLEGIQLKKFGIVMPKGHLSRGQSILTKILS